MNTFLGRKIAQTDKAIWLWEKVLISIEFARIIEFGTYKGNFSLYLYLHCLQRKKDFYTYDTIDWKEIDHKAHLKNFLNFDSRFVKGDVFAFEKSIGLLIKSSGLSIVFCDGGDKVKELQTFTPYLKHGDIIAVHDWQKEVFPKDVPASLIAYFTDLCDEEGYKRFLKRK